MRTMIVLISLLLAAAAHAQVAAPQPAIRPQGGATQPAPSDLDPLLSRVQQVSESMRLDLSRLRVEKWKADSSLKQQMQRNVDSLTANVSSALPEIVNQVRANPQSVAAVFKLYRNLNVLSDVFSNLVLAADNFAPRSDAENLASDAFSLNKLMRSLGDQMEAMATARDAELARLRAQLTPAKPVQPTKIVVDEEPPKKKKPAAKKSTSKSVSTTPAKPAGSSTGTSGNP